MDNRITMTRLSAMLALATGQSGELCEAFLKDFFNLISDELENGENVRVKGLGVFKVVDIEARKSVDVSTGAENEIPAHKRVIFVASKELAARVNMPFEAFEAVEISDELPTDVFMESTANSFETENSDSFIDISDNPDNYNSDNSESEVVNADNEISNNTLSWINQNIDIIPDEKKSGPDLEKGEIPDSEKGKIKEDVPVISFSHVMEDKTAMRYRETADEEPEVTDNTYNITSGSEDMPDEDNADMGDEDDEGEEKNYRFAWGFLTGFVTAVVIIALAIGLCVKFDLLPKGVAALIDRELRNDDLAEGDSEEQHNSPLKSEDSLASSLETSPADMAEGSDGTTNSATVSGSVGNENDGEDAVPTRPSDEPVYDTVTTTRYLTTMAKEHYGNFNLWPIIYEENQAILGHPDRIKPGTKVVIPPLEKYKVNPNNPDDIKRMKQKGVSIYARYK